MCKAIYRWRWNSFAPLAAIASYSSSRLCRRSVPFLLSLLIALPVLSARAAIAPDVANINDLEYMVAFIKQHPRLLAQLESINLKTYTVHYGAGCQLHFERQSGGFLSVQQGQYPLRFKGSTCPLKEGQE